MLIRVYRGVQLANTSPLALSHYGEWGAGIYFTNSKECAEAYSKEVVIECLVNLESPLSTLAEYDDDLSEELDYEAASLGFISDLFDGKRDINEMIQHARESNELGLFGCEITEEVSARGHDSIIANWGDGSKHIVCYRPEAIINIQNIYLDGKSMCLSGAIPVDSFNEILTKCLSITDPLSRIKLCH